MDKLPSTRQTAHWEPRFRTALARSLRSSAHRASSHQFGILIIAWKNRVVSRSANPGLPLRARMGLFRIRRRLYMRVPWREENQLSLGVSFLFLVFAPSFQYPIFMTQRLNTEANLNVLSSCSCLLLLSCISMVQHDPTTRLVEL